MVNERKLKGVSAKVISQGVGIFNFDSSDLKYPVAKCKNSLYRPDIMFNNQNFAKRNFYKSDDGLTSVVKISRACYLHSLNEEELSFVNPSVFVNEETRKNFISMKEVFSRGYLGAEENLKKSAFMACTDLENIGSGVPNLETYSTSEPKLKKEAGEKAGTSFFKCENMGQTEYQHELYFDMGQAFNSCDMLFGRKAMEEADVEDILKLIKDDTGIDIEGMGYHTRITSDGNRTTSQPEMGVLYSEEFCSHVIKHMLNKIRKFEYQKTKASLKTISMEVSMNYGFNDDGEKDVEVFNIDMNSDLDINNLLIENVFIPYRKCTEEEIGHDISVRKEIADKKTAEKEAKKKEKEEKKAKKEKA